MPIPCLAQFLLVLNKNIMIIFYIIKNVKSTIFVIYVLNETYMDCSYMREYDILNELVDATSLELTRNNLDDP
jgi:hypothetical protein